MRLSTATFISLILVLSFENTFGLFDPTTHPNWNLLDHEKCGQSNSDRIMGGTQAEMGQLPWLVRLGYTVETSYKTSEPINYRFNCGSSLISKLYVLTAAHCVVMPPHTHLSLVRLGEYDARTNPDCVDGECAPEVQDFFPSKILHHDKYNTSVRGASDVALIRLHKPAILHDYVTPICLPYGSLMIQENLPKRMMVAGWGTYKQSPDVLSPVLLYLWVPIIEMSRCKEAFVNFPYERDTQICAGGVAGEDSCGGDSGGPLMATYDVGNGPRMYQLGVVTGGNPNCTKGSPGVYMNVMRYMDWILNSLEA